MNDDVRDLVILEGTYFFLMNARNAGKMRGIHNKTVDRVINLTEEAVNSSRQQIADGVPVVQGDHMAMNQEMSDLKVTEAQHQRACEAAKTIDILQYRAFSIALRLDLRGVTTQHTINVIRAKNSAMDELLWVTAIIEALMLLC